LISDSGRLDEAVGDFQRDFERFLTNVETVVRGKKEVIGQALVCLFAQGHLLIEDVPGVAKTRLARAIAASLRGGQIRRIQFTPDLLPSDVVGGSIFNQHTGQFSFRPGPVFTNVLVADEINRASPKTQSALLEVMAERRVTADGNSYSAPSPFLCIATQNPIDHHGTFPLPEAQLDRFMMRIGIGYPSLEVETEVISAGDLLLDAEHLEPVVDLEVMRSMMRTAAIVTVTPALSRYIGLLARATRPPAGERRGVRLGVSPRGCLALAAAARAQAASEGRTFATVGDVKALAVPVLAHRLLLGHQAVMAGRTPADVVQDLLKSLPVPGQ
jgi:MoxR-like ATPase